MLHQHELAGATERFLADEGRATDLAAAAPAMLRALVGLIAVRPMNFDDGDDPEARAAWLAANAAVAQANGLQVEVAG